MVAIRTFVLTAFALSSLTSALQLPIVGGGGHNGGLPIVGDLPGIGHLPIGGDGHKDDAHTNTDANPRVLERRWEQGEQKRPCIYNGSDKELQKKQVCVLGNNKLLPLTVVGVNECGLLQNVLPIDVDLEKLTFPILGDVCSKENYTADCRVYKKYGSLIDLSLLSCNNL